MDSGLLQEGTRTLRSGEVLRLPEAAGRHLEVLRGAVWITQFGDRRDPVIEAGGSFRFDHGGVSLVQALGGEAVVVLEEGLAAEGEHEQARRQRRPHIRASRREAHRLRSEALSALFARIFAPDRATRELGRLNDHVLRDLGLHRDQLPLAGRGTPCPHC